MVQTRLNRLRAYSLMLLLMLLLCCLMPAAAIEVLVNEPAPYTLLGDAARRGIHVDITQALAQRSGLPFHITSAPYARLLGSIKAGSVDLVTLFDTELLDSCCLKIGKLHDISLTIVSTAGAPISSLEQLNGKLLGMPRGVLFSNKINNNPQIKLFEIVNPLQGVKMLRVGRLDAVASSNYIVNYAILQSGVPPGFFAPPLVFDSSAYALYGKQDLPPATVELLRRTLAQMHTDGSIASILKSY